MKKNSKKLKGQVQEYWNENPCAMDAINAEEGTEEFFQAHDLLIKKLYPYGKKILDYGGCKGKSVLEIGCGMGSHSLKMSGNAKSHCALDLNFSSAVLAKRRFEIFESPGNILNADAEYLPFNDESFDRVYSLGVIHHTPDTEKAISEISRVMKSGGDAIIMLYHKNSIFYYVTILVRNRIKFAILKIIPLRLVTMIYQGDKYKIRIKNALDKLSWKDLTRFTIRVSTDSFPNPLSKVYAKQQCSRLFKDFSEVRTDVRGSWNRPLDRIRCIEKRWGWFLYIFLRK